MASVQLAGPFQVIAGSIGGSTFQRHPVVAVFKNKPRHSKYILYPQIATKTSQHRALFTFCSRSWASLGSVNRGEWVTQALLFTRYNKFGIPYNPNAYQLFMELSMGLALYNIALVSTGPTPSVFPTATFVFSWVSIGTLLNVVQTVTSGSSSYYAIIAASVCVSNGRNVKPSQLKIIASVVMNTGVTTTNLYANYIATYGQVVAGMQAWFSVKVFNHGTGEQSSASYFSVQF